MKTKLAAFVLIFFLTSCSQSRRVQSNHISQKAILKISVSKADYRIGQATGFLVRYKKKMFVLTAGHVAIGANIFWFHTYDGKFSPIIVKGVLCPDFHDVVILMVTNVPKNHPYLELDAEMSLDVGDTCSSYGYARGGRLVKKVGKVVGTARMMLGGKERSYLATTCDLTEGMSGGPVTYNGKVIGVNSLYYMNSHKPREKVGVHVPSSEIARYLDMMIANF